MKRKLEMTVTPLDGEPDCYLVQSETDIDTQYRVEMTPKPMCGCPQMFAKGEPTCKHVEAVRRHTQEQTKPDYQGKDFEVMP